MKYLKLFESFDDIHKICKKYGITNYTINSDGSIDVNDGVDLYNRKLTKLPLKFRNISGYFDCQDNKLTSLEGCPKSVGGSFYCPFNELTSLEGCPENVGGDFNCSVNKLTSLEGCPKSVGGSFYCIGDELTSLEGCPERIGGYFNIEHNDIRDFEFLPKYIGNFYCNYNPVNEVWKLFGDPSKIELLNFYDAIRGDSIVIGRLNEFLKEIGKNPVENVLGYKNI